MQHEQQSDIDNEKAALDKFCQLFNCQWQKMPQYDIDAMLHQDGKAIGFAEVKCFMNKWDDFENRLITFEKVGRLIDYDRLLPVVIIIAHPDRLGYVKLKELKGEVKIVERKDREEGNWHLVFHKEIIRLLE
jgi:hypothetical protein